MLSETLNEPLAGNFLGFISTFPRGLDLVLHAVGVDRHNATVTDRDAVHVRCQVFQHSLSVADGFDVDDPSHFQHAIRQL